VNSVVVVGSGIGGLRTVEELRRSGYAGRITLVGDEPELPYDRPPLSKELLTGAVEPDAVFLRTRDQFDALSVDLRLGAAARALDLGAREVLVGDARLHFDALVIATGARPRIIPGFEPREGVHVLRTLADALRLRDDLVQAGHVVIIGAGFLGSEVAASARTCGCEVTIIEQAPVPLERVLGLEMGAACAQLHAANGTALVCGMTVDEIGGKGHVDYVRLSDKRLIEADVIVVGAGVLPNTVWLEGSGLELNDGVVCDATLSAGPPGIYAIGDLARWNSEFFGEHLRVEHWTNAAEQARHVVGALLNPDVATPFRGSGYFWSDQYGVRIEFSGRATAAEPVIVAGSVGEGRFTAWYRHGDRLVGALTMDSARLARKSKLLIESGTPWVKALLTLEG
jgi:NADPH-dependent 2,4-dienoyl-CoA reductase/sulfur reductase-like enzyme